MKMINLFLFQKMIKIKIYKKLVNIENNKKIDSFVGYSRLFIVYHLGYVDENPISSVIDILEKKINLRKLLDVNLLLKGLKIICNYLKLKCFALKF